MKLIRRTGIAALFTLGFASFANPLLSAGSADINYKSDGMVTAKACLSFLMTGQASNAPVRLGFQIIRSTKKVTVFRKVEKGGLLRVDFLFSLAKRSGTPEHRRCSFNLNLSKHSVTGRSSPEFSAVFNAVRSQFKSNGYKKSIRKNAAGKETEIWTGPNGSYKLPIISHLTGIGFDVTPAK